MSGKKSPRKKAQPPESLHKALVIRSVGSSHRVKTEDGTIMDVVVRGKFRIAGLQTTNPVAVGDEVMVTLAEDEQPGVIHKLLPRKNYLLRKAIAHARKVHILAANVDQAILMFTLKAPRTAPGFADRFLVVCEAYDIPAGILINKADLLTTDGDQQLLEDQVSDYRAAGYPVHVISATESSYREEMVAWLQGKLTFLSGHSGAGKSTLVNLIDPALEIKTGNISDFSRKGMHTTTYAEMHELSFGGAIIDSPGIKEWGLVEMEPGEMGHYFPEIRNLMHVCRFSNCLHRHEPGCAVREAVDGGNLSPRRYQGYLRLLEEAESGSSY